MKVGAPSGRAKFGERRHVLDRHRVLDLYAAVKSAGEIVSIIGAVGGSLFQPAAIYRVITSARGLGDQRAAKRARR